jgi:transcription elongation GreA/GreB family factor
VSELPDKRRVLAELRARIAADLEAVSASQRHSQESSTHEEARAEDDKDTRATELSYLARGLAKRVAELREAASKLASLALRELDDDAAVAMSALVATEDGNGDRDLWFVAPAGGGIDLSVDGHRIRVITPSSPLGRALVGKRVDDEAELDTPRGRRSLTIDAVR